MAKRNIQNNLLVEIGTEEIPARFMTEMLEDLRNKAGLLLKENLIGNSKVETFGTARRVVLYVENLPIKQDDAALEIKGPPKERAYTPAGEPTQAAIGFAQAQGISVSKLQFKNVGGKDYVYAMVNKKGRFIKQILSELLPKLIGSLYLPISMRWGEGNDVFIRPIHWITALFGTEVVSFEYAGIKSGNLTRAHRYVSKVPLKVLKADKKTYLSLLKAKGVLADNTLRREEIEKGLNRIAASLGGQTALSPALLDEVNFLVEYPSFAIGKFNARFLNLPQSVLVTAMQKHQKYFPIFDSRGKILPSFIVVVDSKKPLKVAGGNERVLVARLSDAKFFFEEDLKMNLAERVKELSKVTFYEKLGTMLDKTQRIGELSDWISKQFVKGINSAELIRACQLCKADLGTQMVFEFTELQGEMGSQYARHFGEPEAVAKAIQEHYLPRYAGDKLPESRMGIILSLADKVDSVVGCFSIGLIPTGSADPYALRRQAQGIIQIILKYNLTVNLESLFERAFKLWTPIIKDKGGAAFAQTKDKLIEFFAARLKNILLEMGIRHDVADAALANIIDPSYTYKVAKVMNGSLSNDWFKGVFQSADRCLRLAKSATRENVIESDLIEEEEKKTFQLYLKVNWQVEELIKNGDIEAGLKELSKMTAPLTEYFEKVLVMHQDEKLKSNRLAFIKTLAKMYRLVADFSKLAI